MSWTIGSVPKQLYLILKFRQLASNMSKRGPMQATLVHLLMVLSLVIESEQAPRCFGGGKSEEWLREKLDSRLLSPDQVLQLMKKVSSKSKIAIGETSVEELINLDKITREDCNHPTFDERQEVYQKATAARNLHVNDYCKDRLTKLVLFCKEHAPDYPALHMYPPVSERTVEYFWSLLKDFGSKILNVSEIQKLELTYVYDVDLKVPHILEDNCNELMRCRRNSGSMRDASEQSKGNQLEVNTGGPIWENAYSLCKMFLKRMGH